ncbi:hypothetical protein RHMOL_Rhmol04G0165200 [Rhododendron molle]|uniref:Uncharacterized protein n=1 Tax=Rhododendron molle TaxID=49168 RepID=A0ACC0P138_RHOML|nr:hypothetical protein RHMOL_Rhmol04G0165200 [Rhododendron molle]
MRDFHDFSLKNMELFDLATNRRNPHGQISRILIFIVGLIDFFCLVNGRINSR